MVPSAPDRRGGPAPAVSPPGDSHAQLAFGDRTGRKLFAALLLGAALLAPGAARAEIIVGLQAQDPTTFVNFNQLVRFDSATPGTLVGGPVTITGLAGGPTEAVVGIDYRPSDGALVALSREVEGPNAGRGRVYTVNPLTGAATLINGANGLRDASNNEVLLTRSIFEYGIDFNPAANALRIVAGSGPGIGVADNLRITAGGAGVTNVDTDLNGPGAGQVPTITAIAYDNNFAGATTTTLYGIDFAPVGDDRLRTIGGVGGTPSPNLGQVFDVGQLTTGFFAFGPAGFDISGDTGIAYALLVPPGGAEQLYTVNLATGQLTFLGNYGPFGALRDIAVPLTPVAAVPEPSSCALLAVGAGLLGYARRRMRGQVA